MNLSTTIYDSTLKSELIHHIVGLFITYHPPCLGPNKWCDTGNKYVSFISIAYGYKIFHFLFSKNWRIVNIQKGSHRYQSSFIRQKTAVVKFFLAILCKYKLFYYLRVYIIKFSLRLKHIYVFLIPPSR